MSRFVSPADRHFFTSLHDLSVNSYLNYVHRIKDTKQNYSKWKGLTLMKDPMTLGIYLQILQTLKPKTIIEFGTYEGGTSQWMRDMMKSLGNPCTVHTLDFISGDGCEATPKCGDECLHCRVNVSNDIHFHHVNVHDIDTFVVKNHEMFDKMEHPVLVLEDCHENLDGILNNMDLYLKDGDYFIFEDTLDSQKHDKMQSILKKYPKYVIDTFYCDMWGTNNSWNVNSILVKHDQPRSE